MNRYLQGVLGVLAIVLVIFVGAKARNAFEEYNYIGKVAHDRDIITVAGEGKTNGAPDLARVNLGVQTDGLTVKDTQQKNAEKMNAIIAAVKGLKIEAKDIQTSGYNIYPKIDWRDGKQNIMGYTVSQNVTVKVRNLDQVGEVLGKAGELGANQVGNLQFSLDDPTKLKDEARGKAIDDARRKAEQLADQLGLKIVKVVTFSEDGGSVAPMPYAAAMQKSMANDQMVVPEVEAGSQDVVSNVNVTFEVREWHSLFCHPGLDPGSRNGVKKTSDMDSCRSLCPWGAGMTGKKWD